MLGLSAAGIDQGMMYATILGSVNVIVIVVLFAILDRGRLISPAYGRMQQRDVERLRQVTRRAAMAAEAGR
jgi:hypothetical protein